MVATGNFQIRTIDLDFAFVRIIIGLLSTNATRIITVEIADHSVCAVIQIQVTSALHVETGTVGIRRIRNQFEVDIIQTQVCAGDQVGRAAILIGMDMRINVQREILKRNVTAACIDANPFQRQRVGIAAGNSQGLPCLLYTSPNPRD